MFLHIGLVIEADSRGILGAFIDPMRAAKALLPIYHRTTSMNNYEGEKLVI
jgi:hypothetical protein